MHRNPKVQTRAFSIKGLGLPVEFIWRKSDAYVVAPEERLVSNCERLQRSLKIVSSLNYTQAILDKYCIGGIHTFDTHSYLGMKQENICAPYLRQTVSNSISSCAEKFRLAPEMPAKK